MENEIIKIFRNLLILVSIFHRWIYKATAKDQAPVVQKVDSAIRWINLYPVDSAIGFPNTYPVDSDLSSG